MGTQRHTFCAPRHAVGGRLTIWHVDPSEHVPPQNYVPYAPHDGGGPVQPRSPVTGSGAHELPLEHTPTMQDEDGRPVLQSGSDVVVVVGRQVVAVVPDVVVVVTVQQKPTAAASSCTSPGLHASRILTPVLNVPSLRGLAHRTAAPAVSPTEDGGRQQDHRGTQSTESISGFVTTLADSHAATSDGRRNTDPSRRPASFRRFESPEAVQIIVPARR